MRRRTMLACGACVGLAALWVAYGGPWFSSGEAQATDLDEARQWANWIGSLRTFEHYTRATRTPQMHPRAVPPPGVVRVDLELPMVTFDTPNGRYHWDRTSGATWHPAGGELEQLPDPVAQMVDDVVSEVQGGFANTTFLPFDAATVDPKRARAHYHNFVEFDLPFAWADEYLVYGNLGDESGYVSVRDRQTLEPVKFNNYTLESMGIGPRNIPLDPDAYGPLFTTMPPTFNTGTPYFQRKTKVRLVWDEAQSSGLTQHNHALPGWVWSDQTCPEAPVIHELAGVVVFRFPDDPEALTRIHEAQAGACEVELDLSIVGGHVSYTSAQRTCFQGTLELVDEGVEPAEVVYSKELIECRNGPVASTVPYRKRITLPPGRDPAHVVVRFSGGVRIHCLEVTDRPARVAVRVVEEGWPRYRWDGCHPDF